MTHWLNDRLKVASEEPSQELTNLRSKLTKHQAFEMELQANKHKIDSINEVRERERALIISLAFCENTHFLIRSKLSARSAGMFLNIMSNPGLNFSELFLKF